MSDGPETSKTLVEHTRGNRQATEQLMSLVYSELRALAGSYMRGERPGHTLQPTALVHEAFIRMLDIERVDWKSKSHFFAMAARQMRRILVDHARKIEAGKRGGRLDRVSLDDGLHVSAEDPAMLIALDQTLESLGRVSSRQAEVAEFKLFAGMEVKEIALVIGVSERTVKSDWRFARAWLMRELDGTSSASDPSLL